MPPTCPTNTDFLLDSPEDVRLFSYFKDAVAFPLHLLAAYCILARTPNNMHSMKWSLLNFHFWNVMFDLTLLLSVPIPLFPMPAAVMSGIFTKLDVPATIQLLLIVTSVCYVSVSTLIIFENRFFLLNSKRTWWKKCRPVWVVVNCIIGLANQVPAILEVSDQKLAKNIILNSLPCVPDFLYTADTVLPSLNDTTVIISTISFVAVIFGQLTVFTTIIIVQLFTNFGANTLSITTRRLQRSLMKALVFQCGIPVMYLLLPGIYAVFSVATEYFSMQLNNLVAATASLHGIVSTLSILMIHQPYRNTVFFWMGNKKKNKEHDSRWARALPSTNTGLN